MMFAVTAHLHLSGSLINWLSPHFHILSKAMMTAAVAVIIAFVRIVFITMGFLISSLSYIPTG